MEQAVALARTLVRQLTDALDMLAEATVSANRLAATLAEAATDPKVLVEAGKQVTDAEQEQRGWGVNPAPGAPV
ncbi:hypothetical protein BJF78_06105 [Pseudonocardia sp. CNS-139]|nr:hypothetical protein BJF78_06105 [Pseudonocardia sp. CNS-139]